MAGTDFVADQVPPNLIDVDYALLFFCPLSRGQRLLEEKDAMHQEDIEKESREVFQHLQNAVSWDCSLEKARSVSIVADLFRFPSICVTLFSFR